MHPSTTGSSTFEFEVHFTLDTTHQDYQPSLMRIEHAACSSEEDYRMRVWHDGLVVVEFENDSDAHSLIDYCVRYEEATLTALSHHTIRRILPPQSTRS